MSQVATNAQWREAERLKSLLEYDILDTPPDPAFDEIVRVAAEVTGAPYAYLGFLDAQSPVAEVALRIPGCGDSAAGDRRPVHDSGAGAAADCRCGDGAAFSGARHSADAGHLLPLVSGRSAGRAGWRHRNAGGAVAQAESVHGKACVDSGRAGAADHDAPGVLDPFAVAGPVAAQPPAH